MSTRHRQHLSLLSIPSAPSYNQVHSQGPLYSPAIQTAFHQTFPPAFPPPSLLQTPIQPSFFLPPSTLNPRPSYQGHRPQPSAALAAAGILPPPGVPLPTLQHNQFSPAVFAGSQFPSFQPRNRRQPSVSAGGPPKALLGGAGKNYRPPSPTAVALATATAQVQKGKRAIVNLPRETISGVDGEPSTRSRFARTPVPLHLVPPQQSTSYPDVLSATIYPEDSLRLNIPNAIDSAWETVKRKFIEEKLEKLGVEMGSGSHSTVPHIHAPHARAASISSPADPALLYFKLNKLQQAQNSLLHPSSVSPRAPPETLSDTTTPPPITRPAQPAHSSLAPPRHGHSLSLAAPPFIPTRPYMALTAPKVSNPLGPSPYLASVPIRSPDTQSDPGAPTDQSLAPLAMPVRADSRPDFFRGFGLDVPEETEEELEKVAQEEKDGQGVPEGLEEEEEQSLVEASIVALASSDDTMDMELDVDEADAEVGSITTAAHSRIHSRHVSRLSAALSLLTIGGHVSDETDRISQSGRDGELEDDAIGEWTGSEDMRSTTETTEDEESIGEWSNPSDEEHARQERLQRRLMHRAHHQPQQEPVQVPRRIPNFPHPPANSLPITTLLSQPHRDPEEDMISNPSDDNIDRPSALPPVPSSRPPSLHDPALAHSRTPSNNLIPTPFHISMPIPIQAPVPKRTDALNPNAKPFVFAGASRRSGSFTPVTFGPQSQPQQPQQPHISQPPPSLGHHRGASFGKPLNAGAREFKPSAFTFTPPPNMPKFPIPQPSTDPPPLPSQSLLANLDPNLMRVQQGREKRQRRDSVGSVTLSEASEEGRDLMSSFKFPQESPPRKSAPPSPAQPQVAPNAIVRPLTLPGLCDIDIGANKEPSPLTESPVSESLLNCEVDEDGEDDADGEGEESVDMEHELPVPLSMKARRAPIPLDFKHPVSTNTVPAGLFKALANGSGNNASPTAESEERAHRIVRSRLSSREIFEHASRPSLDDLYVPSISQSVARSRLITDPGRWVGPAKSQEPPQPAQDRRSSLPMMASARSSFSDTSVHLPNISHRLELQQYEERLEALLESKLDDFREEVRALRLEAGANGGAPSASTEAAINEVVSLFRTQLQESAARGLDDSEVDARGELDFQLVKDIVEHGHAEARAAIQQDLNRILRRVEALQSAEVTPITGRNTEAMLEEYHARTQTTVVGAVAPITARLEALERTRTRTPLPAPQVTTVDHEALARKLQAALVPYIATPTDYDALTEKLSQAVKPHISQLIDLASDKRETAGLIVDKLIPMLPKIYPPADLPIDIPAFVTQVTAEVRRVVAPIDAHEIKEQVSDLVVERLDSRLAVRDRALDSLTSKLVDGLESILKPVDDVAAHVLEVSKGQQALSLQTRDMVSANNDVMTCLSGLPGQLSDATEPLRTMLADLISMGSAFKKGSASSEDLFRIGTTVDSLSAGQQALQDKVAELLDLYQNVLSRLTDLPDSMAVAIKAAQTAGAALLARTVTKEDFEEVRTMMATNADLQVQLAKARAQYGAVRAEKDIVMERISSAESERDQLRAKVDEIQVVMLLRATDAATSQARAIELEEALSQSLARLKISDVTIENQQERILELEKLNRELTSDNQGLVSRVHSLETQAGLASHDKQATAEALAALRLEHETLLAQKTHWEDLRRTTEQLEHLSALVTQAQTNEPELKELRRIRDRSKALEGEYAALQRRYKEQETRATSSDRTATSARASLAQAQQRAAEWEQRAKEHESVLTEARAALENAEDRAAQLTDELSLANAQLEEKDAQERLSKDRESKLRDQVAALEAHVTQLQASTLLATKSSSAKVVSSPPRPDSRTSTIRTSRSATPTKTVEARITKTSVWDSMHAPMVVGKRQGSLPRGRFVKRDWPSRVASPTPSVVSVAPTLGEDGWWYE
ncbi:hypothetical protein F5148DRAFT_1290056 [Russula earlei]|uniref:Uncharacterized protein n=1 Tax=Russula earlei TaxID=71964 RepID=A0ACC0TXU2_9AGAM|nr:hypothetical protein F5148DRAFT_1290056 [Russula earlei]